MLVRQITAIGKRCNPKDSMITRFSLFQIDNYFRMIRKQSYNEETPPFGGAKAEVWDQYLSVGDSVSYYYQQLTAPKLFIGLAKDFNVPPSELARFKKELATEENIKFVSIKGLTHYLVSGRKHSKIKNSSVSDQTLSMSRGFGSTKSAGCQ